MIRAKRRPPPIPPPVRTVRTRRRVPPPPPPLPILRSRPPRERTVPPRRRPSGLIIGPVGPQRYSVDARGLYRVFNDAEFQLFRSANTVFREDLNGPVPDTYLDENNPTINYDESTVLKIGWSAASGARRAVLRFDLSVLPAGSTVTRARMLLNTTIKAPTIVSLSRSAKAKLRRITQSVWRHRKATWNIYDTGLSWSTPGGDYTETDEVDWFLPIVLGDFEIAGLEALAQDAIDNRSGLLHLILMRDVERDDDADISVRSAEDAGPSQSLKPRIVIEAALPDETDTPFALTATLPEEPPDTYIDGGWKLGNQFFNGALPSGLAPLGADADRFVRIDVLGGSAVARPPDPPQDLALVPIGGGVVQIVSRYWQTDANRATEWAITWTTDGSDPTEAPDVSPTVTQTMPAGGVATLIYNLPAQADGVIVKARLQTRRQVSSIWYYSEGSAVLSAVASASGGPAPPGGTGFAAP